MTSERSASSGGHISGHTPACRARTDVARRWIARASNMHIPGGYVLAGEVRQEPSSAFPDREMW
eukprot:13630171-Heterocapsa_arctica.AAC.1